MPPLPDPEASEKQIEVLRYLIWHIEQHGFQPTQAEMAAHFGLAKTAIQGRLRELANRGILEMPKGDKGRERAIVIRHVKFHAVFCEGDS